MKPAYDNIIWDWNGTLLDDVELCIQTVNDILKDYDLGPLDRSTYLEIFDFPVQDYYERAGMDFAAVSFEAVSARFCQSFEENLHRASLFAEAPGSLTQLKTQGYRQFVLTSTEQSAIARMVMAYGVQDFFDGLYGLSDGLAKGKADAGKRMMHGCALEAGRTILVGDTVHDWEVAQALGIDCVLVATGLHSHDRLSRLGAPVVTALAEAQQIINAGALSS